MYWLLAREVLRMRGAQSRNEAWGTMVDLFMYREPEETEKAAEDAKIQSTDENPAEPDAFENQADLQQPATEAKAAEWNEQGGSTAGFSGNFQSFATENPQ